MWLCDMLEDGYGKLCVGYQAFSLVRLNTGISYSKDRCMRGAAPSFLHGGWMVRMTLLSWHSSLWCFGVVAVSAKIYVYGICVFLVMKINEYEYS
jgi:hypothetical protein